VLCTGNSCRSQITEALLRHRGGERLVVFSAGTEPAAEVHPLAIRVMSEMGLDLEGQYPKDYRVYLDRVPIQVLITVCDGAAASCPAVWPGVVERVHWPTEDPAAFVGGEAETLAKFRRVRDELDGRVQDWLAAGAQSRPVG
jgi:arsenate reductase